MTTTEPPGMIYPDETAVSPSEDDDEGNDIGSYRSSLTSVTSSVLHGVMGEGQRRYAVYGQEEYGLPMDDQELDRMDLCHHKYYSLLNSRHFLAPIVENPQRIMDLGCGTGIWCVEVADEYPGAQVLGVDIAPTQPQWVPPNCQFELDDIEQSWTWKPDSADFIFGRDLILSVRNFPKLIDQVYTHLKPGGWVEFQCAAVMLQCDDGTLPTESTFQAWADLMKSACSKYGTPVDDPAKWKDWFQERGFECVTEEVFKMPCTPWAKDKRLKLIGMWEQHNLTNNLEGLTMRLFQKSLGWTEEEILVISAMLRKELRDLGVHTYWPFYVVYARKPLSPRFDVGG
ncbi:Methyltransferase pytC [Cladobotryum mycophilum]|uniref:Methyltransferase pytC n=1 Tax=Cladobotryum mycophilum TaxID=491253 RepID=A0ABR0SUC1_9HYPO